jgi:hypothetical protein
MTMTAIIRSGVLAAAFAASTLAVAGSASAQDNVVFKPQQGVSLPLGPKHAVGYYVADSGVCQLTLVVGDEVSADDVLPATVSARFRAAVDPGKTARFDTGSGTELQFTCGPAATAMSVNPLQQVAYTARKQ